MKKRDFLAGMICGVFIARVSELDLFSDHYNCIGRFSS
jgi:hypothetical protein